MAAVATPRAPTPRPKAPATVSFLNDPAAAVPTPLATPVAERNRPPLQTNPSARRSARPTPTDYLSDKATAAFIRRVLCSKHLAERGRATPSPIEELLPPLTSRNDVDLQLYALISVILREYVQVWYSKITPDDTFVDEIVQIIAHCTRALEQRLRKVDLESLLFDELPDLLDRHILVQGVLAVLLPTEDLENDCLTSLVGQIFSELIVGNVLANRLSQPWLIYEIFIILTRLLDRKASEPIEEGVAEALQAGSTSALPRPVRRSWSIQGAFWSLVQWSFLAFSTIRFLVVTLAMSSSLPPRSDGELNEKDQVTGQISHSKMLNPPASSNEVQPVKTPIAAFKLWSCVADLIEMDSRMPWLSGIMSLFQLGAMSGPGRIAGLNGAMDRLISHTIHQRLLDAAYLPTVLRSIRAALFPNNAPGVSTLVAPSSDEQLRALRRRCASAMLASIPPWLTGLYLGGRGLGFRWRSGPDSRAGAGDDAAAALAMSESEADVPGRGGATNDNRTNDLGNGSKGDEDENQQRMLAEIEEGILDIFSDEYCNKHLVYSILELILVRLMPELAEKGVVELWEERLSL
ncbi:hypothetical protein COL5a_007842 [Colletotrichum fioriniae]|nr:hypothetical protein COL5a_007842 [Colletotrichum fioriniae]